MDRKVCIPLVILALAVLAGPGTKAAALAGGTATIHAGSAMRQLMSASLPSSMKLEDGVAPELAVNQEVHVHRRVLGEISVQGVQDGAQPACGKTGCPAKGQPYTGHGCTTINRCRTGTK
ncbi:uncharacterized protein LOC123440954 [Hordeum vulgare subsp. vulgare]|uniref:Predicted protein n=1 Tax=Hordeum vulgare subsp. vulgare TaxID=112509 RepID=F2D652_HORVV|nr:uncharacterized protein LOC123440954 [Hordeum vulgare subsp. vulgare]BAJ90573.1 predicted protein [Hordeum vulgare subsp. vulgare]BAJ90812.1 predicted protein [Hordeum vulgare subsp. vulgare]